MLILDIHAHLYESYPIPATLERSLDRLLTLAASPADAAIVLAERPECDFFSRLREGGPNLLPDGWSRHDESAPACFALVRPDDGARLWLIRGCQIQTRERLEVSGILCGPAPDQKPAADDAIRWILDASGLPSLHWALGKWLFGRGRIVSDLMKKYLDTLVVSDSASRPLGWPEPGPLAFWCRQGKHVFAGSDPLPAPGEERLPGSYASLLSVPFDPARPEAAIRQALLAPARPPETRGRRGSLLDALARQARYQKARRRTEIT